MSSSTTNIGLTKPAMTDTWGNIIPGIAASMDKVDQQIGILSGFSGSIVPAPTGTDDTTNIQNAVNAGAGKRVVFPQGHQTYIISASITIPSNTEVDLGGNTIQQKAGSNTQNGLFYATSGTTNVLLKNGTLDVNVANQTYGAASKDSNGRGFFAYNATNIKVERIKVVNPYGAQILFAAVNGGRIRLCELHDENATGTDAIGLNGCSNIKVHNNEFTGKVGVTGYGVHVYGTTVSVSVFDNDLTYYQIVAEGTDYIAAGGGATSTMTYVRIDNNNIIEPSADTSIHFGVYGSVSGNTIINSHDVGISVDYSIHTKINNNVIRTTNAAGIMGPGCTDCTFVGNMISNPGSQWKAPVSNNLRCGIMIQINNGAGTDNVEPWWNVIEGNTIRDDLGTHAMYYGIYIDPNAGNNNVNVVKGNSVWGTATGGQDYYLPTKTNDMSNSLVQTPTFQNSWTNYGSGYSTAGYWSNMDDTGVVHLQGLIKGGALSTVIFTLPTGYRPLYHLIIPVVTNNGTSDVIGRLDINTDGTVLLASGGTSYVSLENVQFKTNS